MLTAERLRALELSVSEDGTLLCAELDLGRDGALLNPLTGVLMDKVVFEVRERHLMVASPPPLVGLPPFPVAAFDSGAELQEAVSQAFDELMLHLQRRSSDLQSLGVRGEVDRESLVLTALVSGEDGSGTYRLTSDRLGNLRLTAVERDGTWTNAPGPQPFELSEFRDPRALAAFLGSMSAEWAPKSERPRPQPAAAMPADDSLTVGLLARLFGPGALVPPKASLEVLVELKVQGAPCRFAAARLSGTTFRGLLAGRSGKLWADRFDAREHPSVQALVATALGVAPEEVEQVEPPAGS